jgi:hypothetical protein
MTKEDITYLAVKLLGLYLTIIYTATFITSAISLFWIMQQNSGSFARQAFYIWQAPISYFLIMLLGFTLLMKTQKVVSIIFKE